MHPDAPIARVPPPLLTANQLKYHERAARRRTGNEYSVPIVLLVLAAVSLNGILAFLNAHGLPIGRTSVVIGEFLIFAGATVVIMASGARSSDTAPALFLAIFVADALLLSLLNGTIAVEMARNAAIISLFLMLGARISSAGLNRCVAVAAVIVTMVLIVEIFSVETFAAQFQPAAYFSQTRGIPPSQFDELGLFSNASGFDDRFAILRVIDHRASSIFLEQVSLANFAVVLAIFLTCRWGELTVAQKSGLGLLIALILVTTNSRLGLGLTLLAPLIFWGAQKLRRYISLLVMPTILIVALVITLSLPPTDEDVLQGRLGLTIRNLATLDLPAIAGLGVTRTQEFADSGYAYVIAASSILGLLLLWLFVSLVAAGSSKELRRCSIFLSIYVFSNLMVSGTSTFSIKTAALLWLLVGYLRAADGPGRPAELTGSRQSMTLLGCGKLPAIQISSIPPDGRKRHSAATRRLAACYDPSLAER